MGGHNTPHGSPNWIPGCFQTPAPAPTGVSLCRPDSAGRFEALAGGWVAGDEESACSIDRGGVHPAKARRQCGLGGFRLDLHRAGDVNVHVHANG